MSLVQIQPSRKSEAPPFALFQLGFRPFFLGASLISVMAVVEWFLVYGFSLTLDTSPYTLFEWHAHQMIYGFSMAVIAGFLLTAVMNWTGIQTLRGRPLQILFVLWLIPRIVLLFGSSFLIVAACFDLLFLVGLLYGVLAPIIRARDRKQLGIGVKISLLAIGNGCYYLDGFNLYSHGAFIGVYGGLFLIVSLILTIGGRVVPPFIRNGIAEPVEITNPRWVALLSLVFFLAFFVNYLFIGHQFFSGFMATILFMLNSYRLSCWHTPQIWKKPLLWGLYCSYVFITLGFLFFALSSFGILSPYIAVHAMAYGGIGLATLAMMSRVSIGHTGRDIRQPLPGVGVILVILLLGAIVRVIIPIFEDQYILSWILIAQSLWICAFLGFFLIFWKMLTTPRIDGQPG